MDESLSCIEVNTCKTDAAARKRPAGREDNVFMSRRRLLHENRHGFQFHHPPSFVLGGRGAGELDRGE